MTGIATISGKAVVVMQDNIDTDQLLPKQFLNAVSREGFGKHLFHDWRYLDDKESVVNPDFPLNQPMHAGATILLSGANFGCGSSREHAPWALMDFGFKVVIAESFADIFFANCVNNQLLLVSLPKQMLLQLTQQVTEQPMATVTVDLASQRISTWGGEFSFLIDEKLKRQLMQGLDRIGMTLESIAYIEAYEQSLPSFMQAGHAV